MIEPKLLLKCRCSAADIDVKINSVSNRKIDEDTENGLGKIWEELYQKARSEEKIVYDGDMYRLERYELANGKLHLELCHSKYSLQYAMLQTIDNWSKLGEEYYPRIIAIGGLLLTNDGKYVFGAKSDKTLAYNKVDFVGGMLEGKDIVDGKGVLALNYSEIEEEIGVDRSHVRNLELIGIVYTPRANIIFVTMARVDLSSAEILKFFETKSDIELGELIFVDEKDIDVYLQGLGGYKPLVCEMLK